MKNDIVKNRIIQDENGYRFFIYPEKSNSQQLGQSIYYNSYNDCRIALIDFKKFIEDNAIKDYNSIYVKIEKIDFKYNYQFLNSDGKLLFTNKTPYCEKDKCKNGIASVCTNIRKQLEINSLE